MFKSSTQQASCTACAKAKRRCSKEKPTCIECWSRHASCQWPKPKPSSFVAITEDGKSPHLLPGLAPLSTPPCLSGPPQSGPWWFAAPETWIIESTPEEAMLRPRTARELGSTLFTVFSWLDEWVETGCNPFIHAELYRHRFPRCIQDAYMVLSCHRAKRPSNRHLVRRLLVEKSQQLVDESEADSAHGGSDPLEWLAQVQALLIYQLIGLYDGDAKLRLISERHMTVLVSWMCRAVDCASSCWSLGHFLRPDHGDSAGISWETQTWHSWILAESLRRTWLVMSTVQSIYMSTRDGAARCLGGMMCTSRKGFWEASSAKAWQLSCCQTYAGLGRLTEVQKLLAKVPPRDVNEFARLMLEVTFGAVQTQTWGLTAELPHVGPSVCIFV